MVGHPMFSNPSRAAARFASVASGTDVGLVREQNEDAVRVNERAGLLVVADGMGGRAAGDVASRIVVDVLESSVAGQGETLVSSILAANEAVLMAARDGRGVPGMGSTCVACRPTDAGVEVAWVGDSRIYRVRGGRAGRLTHDHSYVQTLIDAGLISPSDADIHPERHVLSLCVGSESLREPDVGHAVYPVEEGDRILLCSDGLTGELADDTIATMVQLYGDDKRAVEALIELARDSGGRDNISVVVATV